MTLNHKLQRRYSRSEKACRCKVTPGLHICFSIVDESPCEPCSQEATEYLLSVLVPAPCKASHQICSAQPLVPLCLDENVLWFDVSVAQVPSNAGRITNARARVLSLSLSLCSV